MNIPPPPPPPPLTLPPPPPPPYSELPPGATTITPLTQPPSSINPKTLASAATTLERLRSHRAEREACTLFASSLLAHPLGSSVISSDNGDEDGEINKNRQLNQLLQDPLYPSSLPGGVRDAWASLCRASRPLNIRGGEVDDLADDELKNAGVSSALAEGTVITASMIEKELAREKRHENEEYTLTNGQLSISCRTASLKALISREVELLNRLEKEEKGSRTLFEGVRQNVIDSSSIATAYGNDEFMNSFYKRLNEVKLYHSKNDTNGEANSNHLALGGANQTNNHSLPGLLSGQKRKHGHALADGYDISSLITIETNAVRSGEVYTPEEQYGKYLDLVSIYQEEVRNMRHAFAPSALENSGEPSNNKGASASIISYPDFLSILSKGLNISLSEAAKLRDRRKYARFLLQMEEYLTRFLRRASPFLNVSTEVISKATASFDKEWGEKGCVDGWECRNATSEKLSPAGDKPLSNDEGIDLSKYATSSDLEKEASGDKLKSELTRLGLKCGGSVTDRAARLFLTKDTPLDKLPAKVFAKKRREGAKKAKTDTSESTASDQNGATKSTSKSIADSRVDIARQEAVVSSLLDQLRPTLEGTRRRVERRTTQTENERDQELDEEINGAPIDDANPKDGQKGAGGDDSDEEDEDDAPIYNPKDVPLGWDGKPIPYWLFKLHGLNHFYPCEICGNESYRGRRNFEKHFTESRHAYGMRCLGIPNTKHFHGVTQIADAQELWGRLKSVLEGNQFDVDQEEEYEDSNGNVLNRAQYEDLARQGLL